MQGGIATSSRRKHGGSSCLGPPERPIRGTRHRIAAAKVGRITYSLGTPSKESDMTTVPLTELRDRLSDVLDEVASTGTEFVITRHGRPVAVVLAHDEYESMIETINVLSDPDAMAAIQEGQEELDARSARDAGE
ncbi:type II toxin-antitoxin system Phd/YefM family antitoxin [Micromonospora sp. NPDC049891]|uniref:type II toxin-antitoxin system Phd/YefM family antitoxin n=1 Tax=Micromonospora sp. NPDC049891 TaxID=3155655 RepID=UPI0033C79A38